MLVLQRKELESITIGDDISITILDITSNRVKIAIDAPRSLAIVRSEHIAASESNKEAADIDKQAFVHFSKLISK